MGRNPKYPDSRDTIQAFFKDVSDSYNHPSTGEAVDGHKKQELLAEEFEISRIKIRKILITTRDLVYPETATIRTLLDSGLSMPEAAEKMGMAISTANSLLPYTKGVYKLNEVSAAAERTAAYRTRKEAVRELQAGMESGNWSLPLWEAICAFQGYPFQTSGRGAKPGVKFKYHVSEPGGIGGRRYEGAYVEGFGNEMWISTSAGEKKKSISRSTVELAVKNALEMDGIVKGPKALNVPGAHSYLYPILVRFGVIAANQKMNLDSTGKNNIMSDIEDKAADK